MNKTDFNEIYKFFKVRFQKIIDEVLLKVDFSDVDDYKYDPEKGGILILRNGKWYWSWMNTINTNYSCLYILIKSVFKNIDPMIFSSIRIEKTFNKLTEELNKNKQILFTPKSEIFFDLLLTTQFTWNTGIISTIKTISTINKFYNIKEIKMNFERGVIDDMKGVDFTLTFDGEELRNQHKSCDVNLVNDYYVSNRFIYNEKTYRYNVDSMTMESNGKIYFFYNSTDKNLVNTTNNKLHIHKKLLINIMTIEENIFIQKLTELNQLCFEKRIEFIFEVDESNENKLITTNNGKIITLYLNNVNDEKIIDILTEKIKELQQLPN